MKIPIYSQRCYGALQESEWSVDEYYPRGRKGTQPPSQHYDRNQQRNWNGHVKIRKKNKSSAKYFVDVYYFSMSLRETVSQSQDGTNYEFYFDSNFDTFDDPWS